MKKIICLSGKQYSGKDTLAKILLENLPEFKRLALGDAIKLEFGKLNNLTYEEIDSNKGIYRTGLIELGNKGRAIDKDYWIKKVIETEGALIVPDVRMRHEAEVFKNSSAYLIRVDASFEVRSIRGTITNANDSTEIELDNYNGFDYHISNNEDYVALKIAAEPLLDEIKKKFYI